MNVFRASIQIKLLQHLFQVIDALPFFRSPLAASLTLLLASYFVVGGVFRAVGAGMIKFPRWGWSLFSGLVSLVLGVMLLTQLPVSSIWFVGFAIGVDLIVDGTSLIGFATAIHTLPRPKAFQPAH